MGYADLPQSPSLQFQWTYVDANGARRSSISGATSRTYGLSSADVGERIQVEVRYVNNASQSVVRRANRPTPAVLDAVDLSPPMNLDAVVDSGVLRLSWTIDSGIAIREPTDFQYRYSPFDPPDYTTSRYSSEGGQTVPGGGGARALELKNNLINQATYTIQVRSVDHIFLSRPGADVDLTTAATTTGTYQHRQKQC